MLRIINKVLVVLLLLSTHVAWTNQPTTIRLLSTQDLSSRPAITYAPLFLGPERSLTWPERSEILQLELTRNRVVQLQLGDLSMALYLRPGDELNINLNGSNSLFEATFGDSQADKNNRFFWSYQQEFEEVLNPNRIQERISQLPQIDDYEFELFDQAKALKTHINGYEQKGELSDDFTVFLSDEPKLFYWGRLFAHPVYSSGGGILNIKGIPKVMYENFDAQLLSVGDLNSQEFQQLVRFYTAFATASSNDFQPIDVDRFLPQFLEVSSSLLAGEELAFAVTNILLRNGNSFPSPALRQGLGRMKRIEEADDYVALVSASLKDRMSEKESTPAKKKKTKAKVKHNVAFFDAKGESVRLEDYAGKVVYVDFWAGWCGPCRKQFPYTKKMKAQFSEKELKEIVFLYISIDRSEEAWQAAVEKLELEGEHLFSPGGWRSDACSYFGISAIPRYMILDKDGTIAYPDAPRPSSPETLGILKRLIAE
ncbi:MAG: TlpA disulfide reductase family protein [Bacteroidota bacterium]